MSTIQREREERNSQRARRLVEALNDRDEATVEELVAEDLRHHALGAGTTTEGRDVWWARVLEFGEAFPDLELEVEDLVAEGDRVSCRVTMRGTFLGPLDGIAPTGRTAEVAGFHVLRFEDDRVVEWWRLNDLMNWARQLEVLPTGLGVLLRIVGRQLRWKLGGGRKGQP
jgi:steroid delta-isomerase-like uncharacterized protein